MKKLLLLLFTALAITACENGPDGEPTTFELTDGSLTSLTFYADQTGDAANDIKFYAPQAWTASISEIEIPRSGSDNPAWLTLSAYAGEKGSQTLSITLKENLTGEDRKAEIEITCGDKSASITVEQKGKGQGGDVPTLKRIDQIGITDTYYNHDEEESRETKTTFTFGYDNQSRVESIAMEGLTAQNAKVTAQVDFEYTANKVVINTKYTQLGEGEEEPKGHLYTTTITLDSQGYAKNVVNTEEDKNGQYTYNNGYLATYLSLYERESWVIVTTPGSAPGEPIKVILEEKKSYSIEWTSGNLTRVTGYSAEKRKTESVYKETDRYDDELTYTSIKNDLSIDLNWFLFGAGSTNSSALTTIGELQSGLASVFGKRSASCVKEMSSTRTYGFNKNYKSFDNTSFAYTTNGAYVTRIDIRGESHSIDGNPSVDQITQTYKGTLEISYK